MKGTCLSILFFSVIAAFKFSIPTRALNGFSTDHMSHWASSTLFWQNGFDLYRKPSSQICPPLNEQTKKFANHWYYNPQTTCFVPNDFGDSGLINWSQYPRPYPPGAFLYAAPEGLIHQGGLLSFSNVNLISILKFIIFAHLAILVFLQFIDLKDRLQTFIILPLIVTELLNFSLMGFYDAIGILFIAFAFLKFSKDRTGEAILFWSLGVFFHFRALWWSGLLIPVLFKIVNKRQLSKPWLILPAFVLISISAYAFYLLYPALRMYPISNRHHLSQILINPWRHLLFLTSIALLYFYLIHKKWWPLLPVLIWQFFMIINTPETQSWHRAFLLPMFCLPSLLETRQRKLAMKFALIAYLVEGISVYGGPCPIFWGVFGLF